MVEPYMIVCNKCWHYVYPKNGHMYFGDGSKNV